MSKRSMLALGLCAAPLVVAAPPVSAASGVITPTVATKFGKPPVVIGTASQAAGSYFLDVPVTVACHRKDLVQVVAVEVGNSAAEITAVDSRGVNIYQPGGGKWKGQDSKGVFLATTSPEEATNAGLGVGDVITLTYSKNNVWQGAIAVCVGGVETKSGSADNKAGSSPNKGEGTRITLKPSPKVLTRNEPLFVASLLLGDAADTWTESPGYQTVFTLQNVNTLNLAFQTIAGDAPTPYAATNSVARVWSASNRSYKTPKP